MRDFLVWVGVGIVTAGSGVTALAQEAVWKHLGGMYQYRMYMPAATIGDINGDGVSDIAHIVEKFYPSRGFVNAKSEILFLSGADGSVIRKRHEVSPWRRFHMVAPAGDVDRDGMPDYACTHRPNGAGDEVVEIVSGVDDRQIYSISRPLFRGGESILPAILTSMATVYRIWSSHNL
jgi:hypothetical protein